MKKAEHTARQAFKTAIALICEARCKPDSADDARLVRLARSLMTICTSESRKFVHPLMDELLEKRRQISNPLPRIDCVTDATAIGLAVSFGLKVLQDGFAFPLKGDDPNGRQITLNPDDAKSLAACRKRLKKFEIPSIEEMWTAISDEISGASALRIGKLQPPKQFDERLPNDLANDLPCAVNTPRSYAQEAKVHPRDSRGAFRRIPKAGEAMEALTEHEKEPGSVEGEQKEDEKALYMPATWFRDEFGILASRLRAAKRNGRLAAKDLRK